jgi:hypothetical protein
MVTSTKSQGRKLPPSPSAMAGQAKCRRRTSWCGKGARKMRISRTKTKLGGQKVRVGADRAAHVRLFGKSHEPAPRKKTPSTTSPLGAAFRRLLPLGRKVRRTGHLRQGYGGPRRSALQKAAGSPLLGVARRCSPFQTGWFTLLAERRPPARRRDVPPERLCQTIHQQTLMHKTHCVPSGISSRPRGYFKGISVRLRASLALPSVAARTEFERFICPGWG